MTAETKPHADLRQVGARPTTQRLAVIKAVGELDRHFEAEQLVDHLRRRGERVSRATVYRTLPLLVTLGVLREVHSTDRHRHYERTDAMAHHDHLVCLECGRVEEFMDPRIEALQREVCHERSFAAVGHRTEIVGLCCKCRQH